MARLSATTSGSEVSLSRDGTIVRRFLSGGHDQLIVDSALVPGYSYTYILEVSRGDMSIGTSEMLKVTTLLATAHSFSWRTFLLGGAESSTFWDVSVVSDSLAFAVGELYAYDSSGVPEIHPYSIAVWDGNNWQLRRLKDSDGLLIPSIRGVLAFGRSDVWLADGGIHHWDGYSERTSASFQRIQLIGGTENGQSVDHLCGALGKAIYGGGRRGFMTTLDGGRWTKIEGTVTTDIQSPWGYNDAILGRYEILFPATSYLNSGERGILRMADGSAAFTLNWDPQIAITTIWTPRGFPVFAGGDGLREWKEDSWQPVETGVSEVVSEVRGTALNDIFVSGVLGSLSHFNGEDWRPLNPTVGGGFSALDAKGNTVIAVGDWGPHGMIAVGRRQ